MSGSFGKMYGMLGLFKECSDDLVLEIREIIHLFIARRHQPNIKRTPEPEQSSCNKLAISQNTKARPRIPYLPIQIPKANSAKTGGMTSRTSKSRLLIPRDCLSGAISLCKQITGQVSHKRAHRR